jgi:hypothetical protein
MLRPVPKPQKQPRKPTAKKKKSSRTNRSKLIKEIDAYDSDIALVSSEWKCWLCGNKASQNHHFFPKKSHGNVRFTHNNHCPLCFACHIYRVHGAGEVEELRDKLIEHIGQDAFNELKVEAYLVAELSEAALRALLEKKMLKMVQVCTNVRANSALLSVSGRKRLAKARNYATIFARKEQDHE